ncbi:MAG: RNA polymerase sigma factor (sigma-70 family) [Polaribacter sp.]|jgi:RNA polymerase sigma factor (sigma-70 family)
MITSKLSIKALAPSLLIQRCIAGKKTAQVELYNTYSPTMFGICLRYSNDYHSAEDLLQEGFIKAFNNIDRYKAQGSFEGWLKRIFINTAIEQYRKSKRLSFLPLEKEQQFASQETNALDKLVVEDLLKLLQKTPYGYRTVFNLYVVEGYNHREIAELLGISEGTSKSQLARARSFLKELILKQN